MIPYEDSKLYVSETENLLKDLDVDQTEKHDQLLDLTESSPQELSAPEGTEIKSHLNGEEPELTTQVHKSPEKKNK